MWVSGLIPRIAIRFVPCSISVIPSFEVIKFDFQSIICILRFSVAKMLPCSSRYETITIIYMNFELTEEQLQIKFSIREFAESEIRPHVMEWDEAQHFPEELRPKLAELGLMGVLFPEEYGGAGMGYVEYATIIEELSRVDGSVGISVAAHNSLCSNHIYQYGTEEQKQRFVVPLAKGEKLGAWSLTEPEAGSDAGGTRTTARLDGNQWILNGQKTFTTHAI